ncbi:zinc ABC transporter substrate-binding protein [Bacteroides sp. f07]|uniref:metal ABC transporter solute-binding protein, Zn/Mn family n=1 Tax=Bacteroides sp. f07 TaxID=3132704 RepID=UPI00280B82C9|nr:zinc ABC transporter substrate-binding protein [uncultured Bacteroides sp.]
MRKQLKDIRTLLFLGSCLLLAACTGRASKNNNGDEEKPVITVTLEPQRYFTEAIAGDKFKVVSMVPKGSSPETYDPVPQQLVSLGDSKAYFRIGYIGFEQTWMERLMNNTPHIQVFDTSKGIDLILNNGNHDHNHGHGTHDGHIHAVEPHVWNSTANALIIAGNTYKALSQLDKANDAYYMARYDSLCQRIQHTDSLIRQQLSAPEAAKSFMIYHPALSYFARDYGLHQISIEEGGKEPSPAHLKKLIDLCKAEDVRVIFVQPEFDKRNAETIAQQTGTKVVPINPLSYDWEEEMLDVAKALAPAGTPK